jgi:hypothetical protein
VTPDGFTEAVAQQLHLRGVPFDRGALVTFIASAWPLIEEDPDPVRWATEFIEVARAQRPFEVP